MHRRTALITAASIAAVVLTGATAVGANIGILSSASASDVGDLTAVAQVQTLEPVPTAVEPTVTPTVGATAEAAMTSQVFQADAAGFVEVQFDSDQVRLGSVDPASGWTWSSAQQGDSELVVSFTSGDGAAFEFFAELLPDGTLTAKVDENIVQTVQGEAEVITVRQQAPATAAAQPTATDGSSTSAGAAASPAPVTNSGSSATAAPVPTTAGVSATPVPVPTSGSGSSSSFDDDDDEFEYEDEHDDEHDDEHEDEHDDEDEHEEHEYEGADDDD